MEESQSYESRPNDPVPPPNQHRKQSRYWVRAQYGGVSAAEQLTQGKPLGAGRDVNTTLVKELIPEVQNPDGVSTPRRAQEPRGVLKSPVLKAEFSLTPRGNVCNSIFPPLLAGRLS